MDDILNNLSNLLNQIISQLQQTNIITADNLKLLCFIAYKQKTEIAIKAIDDLLTIAFGLININTIVINQFNQSSADVDLKEVFDTTLNNDLQKIYNQGDCE